MLTGRNLQLFPSRAAAILRHLVSHADASAPHNATLRRPHWVTGLNRSRGRALRRAAWPCQQWMERWEPPAACGRHVCCGIRQSCHIAKVVLTLRHDSRQIPVAPDASSHHTSRGFLHWRLAYAGPAVRRATVMGPASANLHMSRLGKLARPLFDYLVGTGEQRRRHGEAKRLGGL
jgi:hypothetical protein